MDVLFALTGDVRRNSRALRQLEALQEMQLDVEVICFGPPASALPPPADVELHVLKKPEGRGPSYFAKVHREFSRAARARRARVYHASDLYTLPAMAAAAADHEGRLVFDARELYARVASTRRRPWTTLVWKSVEWRYIRRADVVFTVSDSIAEYLSHAYDIPRPTVLHNVPPRQEVEPSPYLRRVTATGEDDVLVLHQGQMRPQRGLPFLVEAFVRVPDASLVFLGSGPLKNALERQVDELGLKDRVHFVDPVPPHELLPVTAGADVGVTLLEDSCLNHRFALPNKLFEYLMAGLPVLGSHLPEISGVIDTFDVGRTVDPGNLDALSEALSEMVGDVEARAGWRSRTRTVFETFSPECAFELFTDQYRTLLSEYGAP